MTKTQEYAEKTKAHIDQLAGEIEMLQSRTEKVMDDLRAEYDRKLQEISVEYDRRLQGLSGSEKDVGQKIEKSPDRRRRSLRGDESRGRSCYR